MPASAGCGLHQTINLEAPAGCGIALPKGCGVALLRGLPSCLRRLPAGAGLSPAPAPSAGLEKPCHYATRGRNSRQPAPHHTKKRQHEDTSADHCNCLHTRCRRDGMGICMLSGMARRVFYVLRLFRRQPASHGRAWRPRVEVCYYSIL